MGRLSAHPLRQQVASDNIPQIKDSSNVLQVDPVSINSTFCSFYSSLYKSNSPSHTTDMNIFLDNLEFPTV